MVLPVLAAVACTGAGAPLARRMTALAAAVAATVTGWWLSGLFLLGGEGSLAAGGLGYYSMNLLAFISPGDWSAVLPALPVATDGQLYEGFQYLGLGILLLATLAVGLAWRGRTAAVATSHAALWTPLVVVTCLAMTAFAVSPVVTFGSRVVLNLDGAWAAPLAMFRSSARFVWPLVYVGLTSAIVMVARGLSGMAGVCVLGAAVVIQLADLHGAHAFRRQVAHDPAFHAWENPFDDPRWREIAPAYAHLVLVPPPQCGAAPVPYEPAVGLAAATRLTINAGVVARRDEAARTRYCQSLDAEVAAGTLRDDSLYVVAPDAAPGLAATLGARGACGEIDGVWICSTAAGHARWQDRAGFNRLAGE
jgi:hypothetical protein